MLWGLALGFGMGGVLFGNVGVLVGLLLLVCVGGVRILMGG